MRFALVMHNPLGSAFYDCAKHILGYQPELKVFDIAPDAEPHTEVKKIIDWVQLKDTSQAILILSDLYGATPFNIATLASKTASEQGYDVETMAGANLCMLMKALTEPDQNIKKLIDLACNSAQRGIVKPEMP